MTKQSERILWAGPAAISPKNLMREVEYLAQYFWPDLGDEFSYRNFRAQWLWPEKLLNVVADRFLASNQSKVVRPNASVCDISICHDWQDRQHLTITYGDNDSVYPSFAMALIAHLGFEVGQVMSSHPSFELTPDNPLTAEIEALLDALPNGG